MLKEIFSVKKILVLVDRFGVIVLFALVLIAFVAAVIEATPVKSLGSALVDTFTSDAKDSEGYAKIMHILLTLAVGWAAIKVYIATAGYKWDALIARYFVKQHIVIMAGRSAETKPTPSHSSTNSEASNLADQTALAIDIAIALAPEQKVVLNIPNLHSSPIYPVKEWLDQLFKTGRLRRAEAQSPAQTRSLHAWWMAMGFVEEGATEVDPTGLAIEMAFARLST